MPVFQFYLSDDDTAVVLKALATAGRDPSISKLAKRLVLSYAGGEINDD